MRKLQISDLWSVEKLIVAYVQHEAKITQMPQGTNVTSATGLPRVRLLKVLWEFTVHSCKTFKAHRKSSTINILWCWERNYKCVLTLRSVVKDFMLILLPKTSVYSSLQKRFFCNTFHTTAKNVWNGWTCVDSCEHRKSFEDLVDKNFMYIFISK